MFTKAGHPDRVCFSHWAQQPTVGIACDGSDDTPKWAGQPPGLHEGVYLRDDDRRYTFTAEQVTCRACLAWIPRRREQGKAMAAILAKAEAEGQYAAHPTDGDFALCQELADAGLLVGVQTPEDGLVLFKPRGLHADHGGAS